MSGVIGKLKITDGLCVTNGAFAVVGTVFVALTICSPNGGVIESGWPNGVGSTGSTGPITIGPGGWKTGPGRAGSTGTTGPTTTGGREGATGTAGPTTTGGREGPGCAWLEATAADSSRQIVSGREARMTLIIASHSLCSMGASALSECIACGDRVRRSRS